MPIPGILTLSKYDPANPSFTTEAAIDNTQTPKQVVLKDPPADTLPSGGTLNIFTESPYAFGSQDESTVQAAIAQAEGGDGIYEKVIEARDLPSNDDCDSRAASEIAVESVTQFNLNFETDDKTVQTGDVQQFSDTDGGVDPTETIIQTINRTLLGVDGTASNWQLACQCSIVRTDFAETIAKILDRNARSPKESDLVIPT